MTPPNPVVGTNALLGVKSVPPMRKGRSHIESNETWLGSPPVRIPAIENSTLEDVFDSKTRYAPTAWMKGGRYVWEVTRRRRDNQTNAHPP